MVSPAGGTGAGVPVALCPQGTAPWHCVPTWWDRSWYHSWHSAPSVALWDTRVLMALAMGDSGLVPPIPGGPPCPRRSVDGLFRPRKRNAHVPLWNYTLLRAQVGVPPLGPPGDPRTL